MKEKGISLGNVIDLQNPTKCTKPKLFAHKKQRIASDLKMTYPKSSEKITKREDNREKHFFKYKKELI